LTVTSSSHIHNAKEQLSVQHDVRMISTSVMLGAA